MIEAKRINFSAVFVILTVTIIAGVGLFILLGYYLKVLTDYIVITCQINEFYADKLLGFFYLICSGILCFILMIIDGDEKRLQKLAKKYVSKRVVKDYYKQSGIVLAGATEKADLSEGEDDSERKKTSARIASSVRPRASLLEEEYKSGKLNGTFKEFYPDGVLMRETRYINGKLDGLYCTYYEDGQLEQKAVYLNGEIEGLYVSYYKNGILHQEKNYIKGKLNGIYKAYDELGIPFFEITYKNDIQHGTDKIFDQMGVLQFMDTYLNGVVINRKTYDEYGNLKFDQYFEEAPSEYIEAEKRIKDREMQEKQRRRQKKNESQRPSAPPQSHKDTKTQ